MKHRAISWLLLLITAGLCYICLRYFFGDFQGYLTLPINDTNYGFAHIKSATEWVSGHNLISLPDVGGVSVLASILALAFAVRFTYRANIERKTNAT